MPSIVSVFGVEPFRIGGTETFARELSTQLAHHGWDSVLCFQNEPPIEVRKFLELPNVSFEVIPDPSTQSWHTIKSLGRVLNKHRPEILHLHFTGFLGVLPWLAKLFSVKRVFLTDHSSRPMGYVPHVAPLWKKTLARTINFPLTKVICVSDYGYRCMTELALLAFDRYQMIYNGVDLSRIVPDPLKALQFRRRYSIPDGRTIILQVSWIIPEKGIREFLKTAQKVLSSNKNVQFVVVGEGAYREKYMEDGALMGLNDHITWTGLVQDPFTEGVFQAADIVCQLSNWEEVFGWMIAEAMAFGKPVVATAVGGIPELVVNGDTGFLVERGDIQATAERILTLVENPEMRDQLGGNGQERVSDRFGLKQNVGQLIEAYGGFC
jgi:glycosyltransferase involved in cell wall biosynthesis